MSNERASVLGMRYRGGENGKMVIDLGHKGESILKALMILVVIGILVYFVLSVIIFSSCLTSSC